jgi:hypothetical protein
MRVLGLAALLMVTGCKKHTDTQIGDSSADTDAGDTDATDTDADTDVDTDSSVCRDVPLGECNDHEECKTIFGTPVVSDGGSGWCLDRENPHAFLCVDQTKHCGDAGWAAAPNAPGSPCFFFPHGCIPHDFVDCDVSKQVSDPCP